MKESSFKNPVINNKRALFEYEVMEKFIAGIMLTGTEVKSLRQGKANMGDAFCQFDKNDLWVKHLNISAYEKGSHFNHEPMRERKLLLKKRELDKLKSKVKERGFTIVPISIFFSDRGLAKIEIGLVRGKKTHDKRDSIKSREQKRELDRIMKER
ncbi:MAG TPA: SsrA-binding protein [Bacteroidetes bacterium]|nr:SsrA-binding protein [Bacteroidota bacterium]